MVSSYIQQRKLSYAHLKMSIEIQPRKINVPHDAVEVFKQQSWGWSPAVQRISFPFQSNWLYHRFQTNELSRVSYFINTLLAVKKNILDQCYPFLLSPSELTPQWLSSASLLVFMWTAPTWSEAYLSVAKYAALPNAGIYLFLRHWCERLFQTFDIISLCNFIVPFVIVSGRHGQHPDGVGLLSRFAALADLFVAIHFIIRSLAYWSLASKTWSINVPSCSAKKSLISRPGHQCSSTQSNRFPATCHKNALLLQSTTCLRKHHHVNLMKKARFRHKLVNTLG